MRRHSSPGPQSLRIPSQTSRGCCSPTTSSTSSGRRRSRPDTLEHKDVPRRFNLRLAERLDRDGNCEHSPTAPGLTTLMVRNIPYSYTPLELLDELQAAIGFQGTFDFFYLPANCKLSCNVGYGFINFRNPDDCERFKRDFAERTFDKAVNGRKVVGQASYAHVQGLDANLEYLKRTRVGSMSAAKGDVNNLYAPMVFVEGREDPMSVNEFTRLKNQESAMSSTASAPAVVSEHDDAASTEEEQPTEELLTLLRELVDIFGEPASVSKERDVEKSFPIDYADMSSSSSQSSGNPFDIDESLSFIA
ncbi:hypothetical protein FOZ61_003594 [Perkinsus olseni]|uniref:RRM domain-containing protein n=1 Tax=Perkinsus olseni TaxID=32597 RepID=A0A7J6LP94_PEROL|nr:hypothetical protein FOZ61_003594 [Perkinsus olseni]KAF4666756.1 hypothetical protein FOL46_002861 [Perkinsus olseni]